MTKARTSTPRELMDRPISTMRDARIWLEGLAYFFEHDCHDECRDWARAVEQIIGMMKATENVCPGKK